MHKDFLLNNDHYTVIYEKLCAQGLSFTIMSLEHIVQAATKALDALKKMKAERNASSHIERKRVMQEMSSLFHSKRPKTLMKCAWRHKFYCLAYTDQDKFPTCEADKDELYRAGLGEKEISFKIATFSWNHLMISSYITTHVYKREVDFVF